MDGLIPLHYIIKTAFFTLSFMYEIDNKRLHSMITDCDGENISGLLKEQNNINAVELRAYFRVSTISGPVCVCKNTWKLNTL